jgi:hypothetical protein
MQHLNLIGRYLSKNEVYTSNFTNSHGSLLSFATAYNNKTSSSQSSFSQGNLPANILYKWR